MYAGRGRRSWGPVKTLFLDCSAAWRWNNYCISLPPLLQAAMGRHSRWFNKTKAHWHSLQGSWERGTGISGPVGGAYCIGHTFRRLLLLLPTGASTGCLAGKFRAVTGSEIPVRNTERNCLFSQSVCSFPFYEIVNWSFWRRTAKCWNQSLQVRFYLEYPHPTVGFVYDIYC